MKAKGVDIVAIITDIVEELIRTIIPAQRVNDPASLGLGMHLLSSKLLPCPGSPAHPIPRESEHVPGTSSLTSH